jgi:hypothetical protein
LHEFLNLDFFLKKISTHIFKLLSQQFQCVNSFGIDSIPLVALPLSCSTHLLSHEFGICFNFLFAVVSNDFVLLTLLFCRFNVIFSSVSPSSAACLTRFSHTLSPYGTDDRMNCKRTGYSLKFYIISQVY